MMNNLSLFLIVLITTGVLSQQIPNYPVAGDPKYFKILGYESNINDDRSYNFRFDTEDPIHREENGVWKGIGQFEPTGEELGINYVNGQASYYLGDGSPFFVTYAADDQGYRARFTIGTPLTRVEPGPFSPIERPVVPIRPIERAVVPLRPVERPYPVIPTVIPTPRPIISSSTPSLRPFIPIIIGPNQPSRLQRGTK